MNNRPHSREKRVSGNSSFVKKESINKPSSNKAAYGKKTSVPGLLGLIGLGAIFGRKKGSFIGTIIKIVVLVVIVSAIFSFAKGMFSNFDNDYIVDNSEVENNHYYQDADSINNAYIENHNVSHTNNTSSVDVDYSVLNGTRDKFTKIIGGGKDEVTVMIYMIGTDLESQYGAATKDLNEMLHASLEDNINIVIETGGCNRWNNKVISNRYIERYTINSQGLSKLQSNIKSEAMTNPDVLTSFIKYSADNFPANRYMLILWDHGGGSVAGYGYDEKYAREPSMSPDNIGVALKESGIKFDFIGFDACLMANLETALAVEPYADYLIGSEETEPATGWYYTDWLNALDRNTSIGTVDLAKTIIDTYIEESLKAYATSECTQSIVDLGELAYGINKPLVTFSKATSSKLNSDDYQEIANARGNTKEFSKSARLDQVDLVDLAKNFNVEGSDNLIQAIKSAVKYNRTANIVDSYGLSAYFPYSSLSKMNQMVKIYDNINIDSSYADAIKSFASFAASGQIVTQNSSSSSTSIFDILSGNYYQDTSFSSDGILDMLTGAYSGGSDYDNYYSFFDIFGGGYDTWFSSSSINKVADYLSKGNIVDTKQLDVKEKGGNRVISLTDEQWSLIDNVTLNGFIDDGGGYIDLGKDNVFQWNKDGDLIVDSDKTWLSINDHIVAYYMVSDVYVDENNYKATGRIPAYLNGQRVDLIVSFTPLNPYGIIEGAKLIYENSDSQQKGLIEINDGDSIRFVCKYYSYSGEYIDEYQLGSIFTVKGPLELYNTKLDNKFIYTYCLQDVYGNELWTPKSELN